MKLEFSGEAFDTFARVINVMTAFDTEQGYTVELRFAEPGRQPQTVELVAIDREDDVDVYRVRVWDDDRDGPSGDVVSIPVDDVDTVFVI